jgi:hypothetical protein
MCLTSCILVYFFGPHQYNAFKPSGKNAVGCVETISKSGENRVLIFYPTLNSEERYADYKWAMDGVH